MEYQVKVNCHFCGQFFERSAKSVKRFKIHFCNKKCQLDYIRSTSTATEEVCKHCSKTIRRTNNQKRNSKTGLYFCDSYCRNIYLAAYNSSRTSLNPYSHRSRKKAIIDAAKNKCQKCGYSEDPRMLDIHHYDGNHQNNKWENLRCLCTWCHLKHHRNVELIGDLSPLDFP